MPDHAIGFPPLIVIDYPERWRVTCADALCAVCTAAALVLAGSALYAVLTT